VNYVFKTVDNIPSAWPVYQFTVFYIFKPF